MSVKWAGNVEREQKSWKRTWSRVAEQTRRAQQRAARSPNTFKLMICLFRFNRHAAAGSGLTREKLLGGCTGRGEVGEQQVVYHAENMCVVMHSGINTADCGVVSARLCIRSWWKGCRN